MILRIRFLRIFVSKCKTHCICKHQLCIKKYENIHVGLFLNTTLTKEKKDTEILINLFYTVCMSINNKRLNVLQTK